MNSLPVPLLTASAAVYRTTPELLAHGARVDRFGEPYQLHREVTSPKGDGFVWFPRHLAPIGEVDRRAVGIRESFASVFVAREAEQQRVVDVVAPLLLAGESGVIQARAGFGKTIIGMHLAALLGRRVIVLVHKADLRDQWIEAATGVLGIPASEVGVLQGRRVDIGARVLVAMMQSVAQGAYTREDFTGYGFAIADEVHRVGSDQFGHAMFKIPALVRIGMSATPERADGRDLLVRGHIGPTLAVSMDYPVAPVVTIVDTKWRVPTYLDERGERVQLWHAPGRLHKLVRAMERDAPRTRIVVDIVLGGVARGRSVVVFAATRRMVEHLYRACLDAGLSPSKAARYYGGLSKADAAAAQTRPVIFATYKYASEGTDIPALDTAVFATPVAAIEQVAGRILRGVKAGANRPRLFDLLDCDSWVTRGYLSKRVAFYRRARADITTNSNHPHVHGVLKKQPEIT